MIRLLCVAARAKHLEVGRIIGDDVLHMGLPGVAQAGELAEQSRRHKSLGGSSV